jgi:hypothetical protein
VAFAALELLDLGLSLLASSDSTPEFITCGRAGVASSGTVVAEQEAGSAATVPPAPASGWAPVSVSSSSSAAKVVETPVVGQRKLWRMTLPAAVVLVALIAVGLFYYRSRSSKQLAEKGTIVLGDFTNTTGVELHHGRVGAVGTRPGVCARWRQNKKRALPTRTSSPSGKTPTPTSPS